MCYPRPLQAHVPIWVGGSGERGRCASWRNWPTRATCSAIPTWCGARSTSSTVIARPSVATRRRSRSRICRRCSSAATARGRGARRAAAAEASPRRAFRPRRQRRHDRRSPCPDRALPRVRRRHDDPQRRRHRRARRHGTPRPPHRPPLNPRSVCFGARTEGDLEQTVRRVQSSPWPSPSPPGPSPAYGASSSTRNSATGVSTVPASAHSSRWSINSLARSICACAPCARGGHPLELVLDVDSARTDHRRVVLQLDEEDLDVGGHGEARHQFITGGAVGAGGSVGGTVGATVTTAVDSVTGVVAGVVMAASLVPTVVPSAAAMSSLADGLSLRATMHDDGESDEAEGAEGDQHARPSRRARWVWHHLGCDRHHDGRRRTLGWAGAGRPALGTGLAAACAIGAVQPRAGR